MSSRGDENNNYENESNVGDNTTPAAQPRQSLVVIPVLPRPLAIFCLVANIIVPGSGTIVSAFSVFCFHHEKKNFLEMVYICSANFLVGLCQLITVMFLLIGWFWSIIWGCAVVGHSYKYKKLNLSKPVIRLTVQEADAGVDQKLYCKTSTRFSASSISA